LDCETRRIERQHLAIVKPLWEQLTKIHLTRSGNFKDYYQTITFEKRCEKFMFLQQDDVFIEGIFPRGEQQPIGYCISTVDRGCGEIDSLFIEPEYRGFGYGRLLVQNSIDWMKAKGCPTIRVAVADGNETVFPFYQRFGFKKRMTVFQLKEKE
jgi:diamine N-acetyltransferase